MNVTSADEHMWLIPFTSGEDHLLTMTFPNVTEVTGLRLWNYNKSPEDTYRGVCDNYPVLRTVIFKEFSFSSK